MRPGALHPQVLQELANVSVRPLLFVFEKLWQVRKVLEDWKGVNVTPVFIEGSRLLWDSQLHLSHWEGDEGTNPGNNVYVYEGQEGDLELSAWICEGEITPDQPGSLLNQNN